MTMQDYLSDAEQLIPPGEVVTAVHRWQDATGWRAKRQEVGRVQRVVRRRRLRVVIEPVVRLVLE